MKTLAWSLSMLWTVLSFAQESHIQVYTLDKDVEKAAFYFYRSFGKSLEAQLLNGKVPVYEDMDQAKKIDPETFNEENNMYRLVQIIDPETPDDPYNLVDTQMYYKHPVSEANYLQWHENMLEINSNTMKGLKSYYVPLKYLGELKDHDGYAILKLLSAKHGMISPTIIQNNSHALLMDFCKKLYDPQSLKCYRDPQLQQSLPEADLFDTLIYYKGSDFSKEVHYYPENENALTGIVMSYVTERDIEEFEVELLSVAPTYNLDKLNKHKSWYWLDMDDANNLFTEDEWNALMAIQYYSFKRKIYAQFEYMETQ